MRGLAALVVLATLLGPALPADGQGAAERRRPGPAPAAKPAPEPPGRRGAPDGDRNAPVTVDADELEALQKEGIVIFKGNVVARQGDSVQYADRMEVYLDEKGDRIVRAVSTGSVRIITRDCRTATARRAEYLDLEQRVVLTGDARVWQDDNVVSGDTITIYLAQDRSVVQGGQQERVKAVFYPRDEGRDRASARAPTDCRN